MAVIIKDNSGKKEKFNFEHKKSTNKGKMPAASSVAPDGTFLEPAQSEVIPFKSSRYNGLAIRWRVPDISLSRVFVRAEWVTSCSGGTVNGEDKTKAFSIYRPYIKFVWPQGNEQVSSGSNFSISWFAVAPQGISLTGKVSLHYTTNNGSTWNLIASDLPTFGDYLWTVPSVIRDTEVRIKAVWTHYTGDVAQTFSTESESFTIKSGRLYQR